MKVLYSIYHWWLALFASLLFRHPSKRMFVLGVTGTKGKSTTLELINAIFEEAGAKTALLSSVRTKIGKESVKNVSNNTMPGRFVIQNFLRRALDVGSEYAFMEVTSEGVLQHRHRFIHWDATIITNLSPEHIERHGSFVNYRDAKVKFFRHFIYSRKEKKTFFINKKDSHYSYFEHAALAVPGGEILFFDYADFLRGGLGGLHSLDSPEGRRLIGEWFVSGFNIENAAAAVAFARFRGIGWDVIVRAFQKFQGVPGRMDYVQKSPFLVVVDYAHTPDSLYRVYEALKPKEGRLIGVLGSCGGGRDKWKRPHMGRVAAQFCEEVFITNEDPYDEDPEIIMKEIYSGITPSQAYGRHIHLMVDRREAIREAIASAHPGDVVVITGKGSESWIHLAQGKRMSWSDRGVAEEAIAERKKN